MLQFDIGKKLPLADSSLTNFVQKTINKYRQETYKAEELKRFYDSQNLTISAIENVSSLLRPGISEYEAAKMLDIYLKKNGVKHFLHHSFAWFGERSSFIGMATYEDTLPRKDVYLKDGDCFILDTAPYVNGVPSDVGLGFSCGKNAKMDGLNRILGKFYTTIPEIFQETNSAKDVYQRIGKIIDDEGLINIHEKYPFGVLAHRLHPSFLSKLPSFLKPFSWQAYADILSRGFLEETIRGKDINTLDGVWAIEPHISDGVNGTKFEKILVVRGEDVFWLHDSDQKKWSV